MITFPTPSPSELADIWKPIPEEVLAYHRARLKQRLHAYIIEEFIRLEEVCGFKKADLARRLGRDPAQITRWLSAPGNLEIASVSDLLLGCGIEPRFYSQYLSQGSIRAASEDWLRQAPSRSRND